MSVTNSQGGSRFDQLFPLVGIIRSYRWETAKNDLVAGLTVALFTIPQAMAYALIAGFPPSAGIYTAIVASILGAAFGSSEFLINGPTNAISVMIAANIALLASQGDPQRLVILLTLMIGVAQCLVAAFRAGNLTRFVSEPVLIGFTAGAGVYIAVNQLPSALGLEKAQVVTHLGGWTPPHNVIFDLLRTSASIAQANQMAVAVVVSTIILVRGMQWAETRLEKRLPTTFFTVVIVTLGAYLLGLGTTDSANKIKLVQDIEPVTRALPKLIMPEISLDKVAALLGPAFAIGLLGAVEAIAIGKSLASRVGHRFSANRQLVGEGACNIGAALVGGFAASGSFTRTAVNFDAGAVTRLSCIFSGVLILIVVMAFAPAANFIPIAVLSGMLIHIGLRLINVAKMRMIKETSRADNSVMLVTFFGVLLLPHLEHALFLGVALSIVHALRRAEGFRLRLLVEDEQGNLVERPLREKHGDVITIDLQGELFFAAAEELENKLKALYAEGAKYIVLRLQQAYNMDLTCAEALIQVGREARRCGGRLLLSGVRPATLKLLENAHVVKELGDDMVFPAEATLLGSTHRAIDRASALANE